MTLGRHTIPSVLATLATASACALITLAFLPKVESPTEQQLPVGESAKVSELASSGGSNLNADTTANAENSLGDRYPTFEKSLGPDSSADSSGDRYPTFHPTFQQRPAEQTIDPNHQFSEEELQVFSSLPPMCTTDLAKISRPATTVKSGQLEQPTRPINRGAEKSVSSAGQLSPKNTPLTRNQFEGTEQQQVVANLPPNKNAEITPAPANPSPLVLTANFAAFTDHPSVTQTSIAQTGFFETPQDQRPFNPHATVGNTNHQPGATAHGSARQYRLASATAASSTNASASNTPTSKYDDSDPHGDLYSRSPFPSAKQCAECHQQIYEEWSSSSHAYASISPMFHVFEETINKLSQGTIGYFCYRCHSPVSTTMGLRRDQPIWDGPRVFREGVTCIACHRVKTPYGKVDGERRIEPGDIYEPVYGSGDGRGVSIADKYREFFKVKTNRNNAKLPGQPMHRRAIQFEEISKSSFCMSCHQVAVEPGIKLEVVWDQYRASPAYRQGISCQDCHMGRVPGVDEGYSVGPGAVVNGKVINAEKKHSNHVFYGPGYSIAHPGVFPDNLDADRWTVPQWLEFDWRAGWGTDAFEDALADGKIAWQFPEVWSNADDRYDAREIVDANLKKLEYKRDLRRQLLENGSKLDGPFFNKAPMLNEPLQFRYCVTNLNSGHNMPSGSLGAQPQIWMNVVLIGPAGNRLWESGYLDSNGDLADNHSLDVLARKVALDTQLVNFQTKFLTTNVKGTDREMYLPVNFDIDQLPFLRPPQQPVSVLNHPPFIRMESHSIPPLGKRNAKFSVPSRLIQTPGTYRLSIRMRSRAEPIYFMRFCNATPEMQRMMNEWICDFHTSTVMFEVH